VPEEAERDDFEYVLFDPTQGEFVYSQYRTVTPLKSLFYPPLEKVAAWPAQESFESSSRPLGIVGVAACDLFGLKIQDYVFKEGGIIDPFYSSRRDNCLIVSSDCTSFKEVCFCLALEILPHPTDGFDLNLSQLSQGYLIEVGSSKGQEIIERNKTLFRPASQRELTEKKQIRQNIIERLNSHLKDKAIPPREKLPQIVRNGMGSKIWEQEAEYCVECGACNFICDTCHCFLLSERKGKEEFERMRCWDSCQYANFARVAGGANPLKTRPARLRNRFLKKFDFFPETIGFQACCGCGRCIEACPAKIDIRRILSQLKMQNAK
jgi:ferredoxin